MIKWERHCNRTMQTKDVDQKLLKRDHCTVILQLWLWSEGAYDIYLLQKSWNSPKFISSRSKQAKSRLTVPAMLRPLRRLIYAHRSVLSSHYDQARRTRLPSLTRIQKRTTICEKRRKTLKTHLSTPYLAGTKDNKKKNSKEQFTGRLLRIGSSAGGGGVDPDPS